jgi:hypothetical protein
MTSKRSALAAAKVTPSELEELKRAAASHEVTVSELLRRGAQALGARLEESTARA